MMFFHNVAEQYLEEVPWSKNKKIRHGSILS